MSSEHFDSRLSLFDDGISRDFSLNNHKEDDDNYSHHGEQAVEKLSQRETRNVKGCRFLVLLLILVACVIISTTSYYYLRGEEKDDYVASYEQLVETIAEITAFQMNTLKGVSRGLGETFTATAMAQNASFPYVTVPMFEVAGKNAREQSGVEFYFYSPLVTDTGRWVEYASRHQDWVQQSRAVTVAADEHENRSSNSSTMDHSVLDAPIDDKIWIVNDQREHVFSPGGGPFAPIWQTSPSPFSPYGFLNIDIFYYDILGRIFHALAIAGDGLLTEVAVMTDMAIAGILDEQHTAFHENFVEELNGENYYHHPHSMYAQPIFSEIGGSEIVGVLFGLIAWDRYLANLLPNGVEGIYAVLQNNCGQSFTYVVNGPKAKYLGEGDLHERGFDDTERVIPLGRHLNNVSSSIAGHCVYSLHVYSSSQFEKESLNRLALTFAISITAIFGFMTVAFLFYDRFVRKRNAKVVRAAAKSDAILSSLFPATIRDRLFAEKEEEEKERAPVKRKRVSQSTRLQSYLSSGEFSHEEGKTCANTTSNESSLVFKSKPIADLFTATTIMFGDLAGFTAWSSVREPSQVFTLLETLYHSFDEIARRRKVFKVETVGDCYVAVTGLPEPQKDHAVNMCRFARACLMKARVLTKKLEVLLGPDTGDLALRIGLHSGPVTAGVLRGERSRFQLFGDTMNTASRMESTGVRDKIQISQETADLLTAAGKSAWFAQREDKVVAKGKGELQTYFLNLGTDSSDTASTNPSAGNEEDYAAMVEGLDAGTIETAREIFDDKTTRLIDWNVDVLIRLLKQIVAHRMAADEKPGQKPDESVYLQRRKPVLDEVEEIITLPEFDVRAALIQEEADCVDLGDAVVEQLHDYVCNIAAIYRDNPFHSFEHASHVTMSVTKLLSRIVAPSEFDFDERALNPSGKKKIASTLHDHTYGITSDPLTQFACVFSALIHDVDHTGVPNSQLVKEKTSLAAYYNDKSIAEQNSVELSWGLLMDENYEDLRAIIYSTHDELVRFRQLVVNSVMATDIVDKQLKVLRNKRWDRAFNAGSSVDSMEARSRKATIVIEHLIQASDVAHTMQHWHIYRKWNQRFFLECYQAYMNGRAESDPAEGWYLGELGFFDFYIIPLAKKLKDCGVFGVSSDEYLNYAIKNREEWEIRGREIVDEMLEDIHKVGHRAEREFAPAPEPVVISSPQLKTTMARIA